MLSVDDESRTHTVSVLSTVPLPLGYIDMNWLRQRDSILAYSILRGGVFNVCGLVGLVATRTSRLHTLKLHRKIGRNGGTRTLTELGLNQMPLPLGYTPIAERGGIEPLAYYSSHGIQHRRPSIGASLSI